MDIEKAKLHDAFLPQFSLVGLAPRSLSLLEESMGMKQYPQQRKMKMKLGIT